jgi:hypothetical protein
VEEDLFGYTAGDSHIEACFLNGVERMNVA